MAMGWLTKHRPMGLEFTGDWARAALLVGKNPQGSLMTFELSIGDVGKMGEEELKERGLELRRAMSLSGIGSKEAVISISNDRLIFRTLRLAFMPAEEVGAAAHWKMAAELGFQPKDFQSQVLTMNEITEAGKKKLEIFAVACGNETLNQYIKLSGHAGLRIRAIDVSTTAIARNLKAGSLSQGVGSKHLYLQFGRGTGLLSIIDENGLQFARTLSGSLDKYLAGLGQRMGLTEKECIQNLSSGDEATLQAATESSRMFARDISREISIAIQYFEEMLGGVLPRRGACFQRDGVPAGVHANAVDADGRVLSVRRSFAMEHGMRSGKVDRPRRD